jgi:hypothetical protein
MARGEARPPDQAEALARPAHKQWRLGRWIGTAALSVTAAVSFGSHALIFADKVFYDQGRAERVIADALYTAMGIDLDVRCVNDLQMAHRLVSQGRSAFDAVTTSGLTPMLPGTPVRYNLIWPKHSVCKAVMEFAHAAQAGRFVFDRTQIANLDTVVHEAEHARGNSDESTVRCKAIQDIGAFAMALGMPHYFQAGIANINYAMQLERDQSGTYPASQALHNCPMPANV